VKGLKFSLKLSDVADTLAQAFTYERHRLLTVFCFCRCSPNVQKCDIIWQRDSC